jgi:WD40 repeat protein/DNA-directed RNA polymerase subunit RPC12/RpoP
MKGKSKTTKSKQQTIPIGFKLRHKFQEQKGWINDIAWSPDGRMLAIASSNNTIQICDIEDGKTIWILRGPSSEISSIAWSPDGQTLASGCGDTTIWLWNINTGKRRRQLKGHTDWVWKVSWSPDGNTLASSSRDETIRLWDMKSRECRRVLKSYLAFRPSLVWFLDGKGLAASSFGMAIVWDTDTGEEREGIFQEDNSSSSMALSPDGKLLAWGSDSLVLLRSADKPISRLEGHAKEVTDIAFSCDCHILASRSKDGMIRLWRCDTWDTVAALHEQTLNLCSHHIKFHPTLPILVTVSEQDKVVSVWDLDINALLNRFLGGESVRYRNAKVVLIGDQTVGKSGLGMVLAGQEFQATDATHGRQVLSLSMKNHKSKGELEEIRETLIWDLAGQPEFRLIHQLSLDQTNIALLLFDASDSNDPFRGVAFWNKALRQAKGNDNLVKYLIAAKTDVCIPTVTLERMQAYALEAGFHGVFCTSAKTGEGIKELLRQIEKSIEWEKLPLTVSENLFKKMKDFIVNQRQNGHILKAISQLIRHYQIISKSNFEDTEFLSAIKQVESHDLIKILSFGDYVLLQSELLDNYASAMASAARKQPDGLGFLEEQAAREGKFDFGSLKRIKTDEEPIILQAVIELFVTKELAVLEEGKLIFPSQLNRELPEHPEPKGVIVEYKFEGTILNAYATLVVRLYYSEAFIMQPLWKNAALFLPYGLTGETNRCGFILKEVDEGTGLLTVFFGADLPKATKILFLKYVHEHLRRKALNGNVARERIYRCLECQNEVESRRAVKFHLEQGRSTILCQYCYASIPLIDLIEETFGKNDEFQAKVRELDEQINENLDNASKRMILEGEILALVGKARQIWRPIPNDDWGIDGEVEFRNNRRQASGERIYLQLKSGASYLKTRKNGVRTFYIEDERHIEYWQSQRYPVYLVIRDSDEKIYWMNITEYLQKQGENPSRTVIFNGEELTIESLKNVRLERLAQSPRLLQCDRQSL